MKIKELIAELQKLDPNLNVLCSSEDPNGLPQGHAFKLFEIESVAVVEAESTRLDGKPYFKLGPGSGAQRYSLIQITNDV
jgi:hypothetical protein